MFLPKNVSPETSYVTAKMDVYRHQCNDAVNLSKFSVNTKGNLHPFYLSPEDLSRLSSISPDPNFIDKVLNLQREFDRISTIYIQAIASSMATAQYSSVLKIACPVNAQTINPMCKNMQESYNKAIKESTGENDPALLGKQAISYLQGVCNILAEPYK